MPSRWPARAAARLCGPFWSLAEQPVGSSRKSYSVPCQLKPPRAGDSSLLVMFSVREGTSHPPRSIVLGGALGWQGHLTSRLIKSTFAPKFFYAGLLFTPQPSRSRFYRPHNYLHY
ncbi:hypothetical protein DFH94DRAFT_681113 [Russula ochroleuca]|uniref:Uncharacterized protein n=1 Tax=Russula ochroleuca TaxID=152965 RepID=A0A9P5MYG4_9AGAM|nr:hypothetical protein DFH94DRAFT_681113 [Russula ochroleuca]